MKAEITLSTDEWETLFKILEGKHAYYKRMTQRAKDLKKFNPRGSTNRRLQLVTSIQLKLEKQTNNLEYK